LELNSQWGDICKHSPQIFFDTFYPCRIAEEAVLKMVNLLGKESFEVEIVAGSSIKVTERLGESSEKEGGCQKRILHMVCGNMFHLRDIDQADIIMLETEIPQVFLLFGSSITSFFYSRICMEIFVSF
jgi:hypothetical protein